MDQVLCSKSGSPELAIEKPCVSGRGRGREQGRGPVNPQEHSRVPALDRRQELPGPTATAHSKSLECSWHIDLVKVSMPLAWGPSVYSLHWNFSTAQICFFTFNMSEFHSYSVVGNSYASV